MFVSAMLYVVFGNILLLKRALDVSSNVVGALVPAVRASLKNAVFTFDSVKKTVPTQKSPRLLKSARKRFKFMVNALHP